MFACVLSLTLVLRRHHRRRVFRRAVQILLRGRLGPELARLSGLHLLYGTCAHWLPVLLQVFAGTTFNSIRFDLTQDFFSTPNPVSDSRLGCADGRPRDCQSGHEGARADLFQSAARNLQGFFAAQCAARNDGRDTDARRSADAGPQPVVHQSTGMVTGSTYRWLINETWACCGCVWLTQQVLTYSVSVSAFTLFILVSHNTLCCLFVCESHPQVTRRRMEIAEQRAAASASADGSAHSALHRQLSLGAADRFANMKRWDQTDHRAFFIFDGATLSFHQKSVHVSHIHRLY
jgi:hypothetical protein